MIALDKIFNELAKRSRIVKLSISYGLFANRTKLSQSIGYIKNEKILIDAVFTKRVATDCSDRFKKVVKANIAAQSPKVLHLIIIINLLHILNQKFNFLRTGGFDSLARVSLFDRFSSSYNINSLSSRYKD